MQVPTDAKGGDEPHHGESVDSNFRNGSITAVGVILGFSLGFLNQWASNPIAWSRVDIAAAVPIVLGIVMQGKALADLLSTRSLTVRHHDRAKVIFLVGLAFVGAGVAAALVLDILGLGPRTLVPR